MKHTLVAGAGGARLVCIDARYYDDSVLDLLLHFTEPSDIVHNRILAVGRAGADDQHQFVTLPGDDTRNLLVIALLCSGALSAYRIHLLDFLRDKQLALEVHIHNFLSYISQFYKLPRA